ncbi:NUDIX domain-containing protein [soil metagenome]
MRWGIFGAAGVVFVLRSPGQPTRVMLQRRSVWAHEGGTWSCAGGAIDEGESPFEAAVREASEEVGAIPPHAAILGEYVFAPATDWSYTTVVLEVTAEFGESMNFETDAVAWVPLATVDTMALHAGFAAAWPHLRAIIDGVASTP